MPRRALVPMELSRPPITTVGSSPASPSTAETSEVVVVLPCVPATAIPCLKRISSASIIARGTTGTCASRAATTSGLSAFTAEEVTTASAPAMWRASWPMATAIPSPRRRFTTALSAMSVPDTV